MTFVETLLGVSPDGGNGSYELMLLALPIVLIVIHRLVTHWSSTRPRL